MRALLRRHRGLQSQRNHRRDIVRCGCGSHPCGQMSRKQLSVMSGTVASSEGEKLFVVKFNFKYGLRRHHQENPDGCLHHCSGTRAAVSEEPSAQAEIMSKSRTAPTPVGADRCRVRTPLHGSDSVESDQKLRLRRGWVSENRMGDEEGQSFMEYWCRGHVLL